MPPNWESSSATFLTCLCFLGGVLFRSLAYGIYFFAFCGKLLCYTPNTVFVSRIPAAVFMVCSIKDWIACWPYLLSDALTI